MQNKCCVWLETFLRQRELDLPDGRELFRYRTTEREFYDLERLLRNWLADCPRQNNLAVLADSSLFCRLFALYGAEWWRRKYDGSGFSWEPIIQDLRAEPNAWNQQQRSRCIKQGLGDWGVAIRQHGGLRFILSVALQGGLPLRLLAEGRGGMGRLLKRVLQLAADTRASVQDIEAWVESLHACLPGSYRQPAVFLLLADVIVTVLQLKEQAELTRSDEAIECLDRRIPDWRDHFSLPLEDEHAQGLVAQLLKESVECRLVRRAVPFALDRFMEEQEEGLRLCSVITLPRTIETRELALFFGVEAGELPRRAELSVRVGDQVRSVSLRRLAGHDAYRIEQSPWEWQDGNAARIHTLTLIASDGRSWSGQVHRGEELDEDLPWVFSSCEKLALLKQGGGKISDTEALLVLPGDWQVVADETAVCEQWGDLSFFGRKIFRFQGRVHARGGHGESFRFQTGRADAQITGYYWQGKQLSLNFLSPPLAFLGTPGLFTMSQEGSRRPATGKLSFEIPGSGGMSLALGPVVARYRENGELQHSCRMVILPGNAAVETRPGGPRSGTILLKHWGANTARSLTPGVQVETTREKHCLKMDLVADPTGTAPEQVTFEVHWPHTTYPVRLCLPFPAEGVRAFDIAGREWERNARISVDQLLGARIVLYTTRCSPHAELVLRSDNGVERGFPICRGGDALHHQVRLQNYQEDIQQLLSSGDNLDSLVNIEIILEGEEVFRLRVARYSAHLKHEDGLVLLNDASRASIDTETLAKIRIQAVNLLENDDSVVELEQQVCEGASCGCWQLDMLQDAAPGPWLLYPSPETPLTIRPLLWPVEGETRAESMLARAMQHQQYDQRTAALEEVVCTLADDFLDPGWQDVEQLAGRLGHLSLTSLDIWRCFARSPAGMTSLVLRLGNMPRGLVRRFAMELPFAWETVPFSAWKKGLQNLQQQCVKNYDGEVGRTVLESHLETVVENLAGDWPALQYVLGISMAAILPAKQRDVTGLRFGIGPVAENDLFQGDECHLQKLLRGHVDDQWPDAAGSIIQEARVHDLYSSYLCPDRFGFRDTVINLPILLAVQCALGENETWLKKATGLSLLRSCQSFDPEWFSEAYNLTIARCLAGGLFD